jgi:PAS domain S-box-containing protein
MKNKNDKNGSEAEMINNIQFSDLFNIEEIQRLQDLFADANDVASIITYPDGTPITKPSNFTRLCENIIRKTEKGCANCYHSDAIIGRLNSAGPIVQPCLSGGLWDAGASILIGDLHIANWLIGQVRNDEIDQSRMMNYAKEIGADEKEFIEALNEVPQMTVDKFYKVANMLYAFSKELSEKAYNNLLLKRETEKGIEAVEALHKIEEKFQLMFENSPQPMFIADTKSMAFIEVNQALVDHYGYSKEEFLQMTLKDIHLINSDPFVPNEEEKSRGFFYSTKEVTHIKKNGEKIIVEISLDSIIYKRENVIHVLINDITEQKRTIEALRKSEDKFRVLFETMPNGFYRSTPEGYFIDVNPAYVNMLGYESKEEILKVYIPTDCYVNPSERDEIIIPNQKLDITTEEYRLKTKDGRVIWIEDKARYIKDENGKVIFHEGFCSDITERKMAVQKLEQEQFLMDMLMDNLPQNIYFKDRESRFLRISKAHANVFKLNDPKDAVGKSDFDFFTIEHAKPAFKDEQRIIETGLPILNVEEKETWEDNSVNWVSTTKLPMYDKEGNIVGTMGISHDINERKLNEETLRKSEQMLLAVLNNFPGYVFWKDLDSVFLGCNKTFAENAGLISSSEIAGKNDLDMPWSKQEAENYRNHDFEVIKTGEPILHIIEQQHQLNGSILWFDTSKLPLRDANDNVIGTFGVANDITARKIAEDKLKESEEKLSTLFSSMTEMVAMHDLVYNTNGEVINYRITDCNNSYLKNIGIKRENAIGKLATDVYKEPNPPYLEEFSRVAITGESFDYTAYFAPMDKFFMVSVVSPRRNSFATITSDITDMKQAQEEMIAKKNELENYLYIASHDLRSPMVNIQGFSQRLQKQANTIREALATCTIENETKDGLEKIINENIPKTLNFILSNVTKMDTLINGLLQISRTGRIKMDIQKINMNNLLNTIIAGDNFQLTEILAEVVLNELPNCYGDEHQLNQLFSNIIGNAVKYRAENRILHIEISGSTHYNKVIGIIA